MPVTAYCKKCGQDVPVSDVCPLCGRSLPKSARRVAWCIHRRPVSDWMCWNAAARVILPTSLAVLALIVLVEGLTGGASAIVRLLTGGLVSTVLMLLALIALMLLIILRLQGDSMMDCVLDSRGVHVQEYLLHPTPLNLILRLRSPALLEQADWDCGSPMVLVGQREIAWRDINRVQLWPEKQLVLLYAPRWWLRLTVYATPLTWFDALGFIHEKIGRRKDVILPRPELQQAAELMSAAQESAVEAAAEQLTMEEMLPVEDTLPPAEVPQETQETGGDASDAEIS